MLYREVQNAFANQRQVIGVFFDLERRTTPRGGVVYKQLALWVGAGGDIGGNMLFH